MFTLCFAIPVYLRIPTVVCTIAHSLVRLRGRLHTTLSFQNKLSEILLLGMTRNFQSSSAKISYYFNCNTPEFANINRHNHAYCTIFIFDFLWINCVIHIKHFMKITHQCIDHVQSNLSVELKFGLGPVGTSLST